jgi:hypothetical protein
LRARDLYEITLTAKHVFGLLMRRVSVKGGGKGEGLMVGRRVKRGLKREGSRVEEKEEDQGKGCEKRERAKGRV